MKCRNFTLLCLAALIYTHALAQPVLRKQIATGANGRNYLQTMYLTEDDGWIVGGNSNANASCDKTENNRDVTGVTSDYWVVKYDSSGRIQWDKTIGGSNEDRLTALQQTSDGGYILGGWSLSNKSGEKTQSRRGNNIYNPDYWIIKLDKNGKVEWNRTLGGDSSDYLYSLQQTIDNGYILCGLSESDVSGEKTVSGIGTWIVKLDKTGKIQWEKVIYDAGTNIKQTKDGGYILPGSNLVKLGVKGNVQWSKKIIAPDVDDDGNPDGTPSLIEQTCDDGYILGGTVYYFEGKEYWVIKVNSKGDTEWSKTFGTANSEAYNILTSLQQTRDHGYILGGYTDYPVDLHNYSYDYWIVKIDRSGNMQWNKQFGGNADDYCTTVRELGIDRYWIGGWSESGISEEKTVVACGVHYWIAKLFYKEPESSTITALPNKSNISSPEESNSSFTFYPNPTKDILNVQVKGIATLSLTDGAGRILFTKTITNSSSINLSRLNAGVYYLRNYTTGETKRVVVTDK